MTKPIHIAQQNLDEARQLYRERAERLYSPPADKCQYCSSVGWFERLPEEEPTEHDYQVHGIFYTPCAICNPGGAHGKFGI